MSTSNLRWFKSSYSSGPEVDDCVEIAKAPTAVHVRDSKNAEGPRLMLAREAWASFVTALPTAP
ncbi:hypothetical protein QFZ75_004556 [Streptomyces sp. V3I8]|uniref:DUF397 domain-containing protein n=1 Tax=Streptomyces sp. V3I8 TaxID=3042279 RepID=UPI0027847E9C|nr:DUF397 domain-containing protein [Streptomyces sp. V3I8]MDQ1038140.1 hypothetical protein [Streptomyces sp. V3I8]